MMFFLFKKIFSFSSRERIIPFVALFATALYLFHPAIAETINYIIARSDSLSTFFVLLAFVLYIYSPLSRKYFLYLIPVIIGVLAKAPAIMFAPLLFFYIILFEKKIYVTEIFSAEHLKDFISAIKISFPSFIFCGLLYYFVHRMEVNWVAGGTSTYLYFISQPYVILHYFKTFILPLWLSADTDWATFNSIFEIKAIIGFIFCGVLLWLALKTSVKEKFRPISFGIFWFFIALIPSSSFIALSEVMNDHRIFFPYIGLTIAAVWSLYLLFEKLKVQQTVAGIFCILVLCTYGFGTHQRNKVWKTDESLWKDVTEKSPNNARGLMNYGLVLMARADYIGAQKYFLDGIKIWPYYPYLHINMGILKNATGFPQEAEKYFQNAIQYRPELPEGYFYYGEFLYKQKRNAEAIQMLNKTLELSPAHTNARYKLMSIYFEQNDFERLNLLANETLKILPNDSQAIYYLNAGKGKRSKLETNEEIAKANPTAEKYLDLSLEYYNAKKFEECISACNEALKLKPDYDLAYNNLCSAYNELGNWDKAIEAGERAVQLNPNNQLAKNNLTWAKSQKGKK
jgi:tetratricopeptide (TPR) repeat protein